MAVASQIVFERIPAAGFVLDRECIVIAVNPAACAVLGRPESDVVGHSMRELCASGGNDIRVTNEPIELQFDTPDGRRTLQCVVSEVEVDGRTLLQLFGISSRKEESLGIVAGGIAHDFNNLLVGVLAEASAAREEDSLPETTREALRRIEAAAQRMTQLTRLMLAYAGRGRIVAQPLVPDDVLRELGEPLTRIVRGDVKLEITPGAGPAVIEADPALLRQVVINLVANASDAGAAHITVTTRIISRHRVALWQLEVADDGSGIDPITIARIFEPFFSTKPDHHGLGLSAIHGIVRRLGGDIEVDSTVGNGARFRVRLPVLPDATAPQPNPADSANPIVSLANIKVLIADDEPSVRATVRRLLERRGANVVVVADGAEAEERLREEHFGLVILDVAMPARSGYDVLVVARLTHPGTPVILMSGYTNRIRGEGGEEEPDAFLEKPFTARTLDTAIDRVMRRKP